MHDELGRFKKGHKINNGKRRSPATEFKKGQLPWCAGTKGLVIQKNKGVSKGYINTCGYKVFYMNGKEFLEHRLIMERYLGRELNKTEHIHHIDGNKLNNEINNLRILTHCEHMRLHYPEKKYKLRRPKCVFS